MRILYLECRMGAAGDMLMAALLELLPVKEREGFLRQLNAALPHHVNVSAYPAKKCGLMGTQVHVTMDGMEEGSIQAHSGHLHSHTSYSKLLASVEHLNLPGRVQKHIRSIYEMLGNAEASVHGDSLENIHFHEVGSLDAMADIAGCALLFDLLQVDKIYASPVHVGSGSVHCAHGILPVPAPATARLLTGIPTYGGSLAGELCTPTGAAILRYFVNHFGDMPTMRTEQIGIGCGQKDFESANCVRAFLGQADEKRESVYELRCNLDDMTPEAIGYACELLLEHGALDVWTSPIYMKKGRPAVLLSSLCTEATRETIISLLFTHTTTRGLRETVCQRTIPTATEWIPVDTLYGEIRVKFSKGDPIYRYKPEYEDIRAAARKANVPFETVRQAALSAFYDKNKTAGKP